MAVPPVTTSTVILMGAPRPVGGSKPLSSDRCTEMVAG